MKRTVIVNISLRYVNHGEGMLVILQTKSFLKQRL